MVWCKGPIFSDETFSKMTNEIQDTVSNYMSNKKTHETLHLMNNLTHTRLERERISINMYIYQVYPPMNIHVKYHVVVETFTAL